MQNCKSCIIETALVPQQKLRNKKMRKKFSNCEQ